MTGFKWLNLLAVVALFLPQPPRADSPGDYPEAYKALSLPTYENATILSVESGNNLDDGIRIVIETDATHLQLRAFYEGELSARGWVLQETIAMKKMRQLGVLDTQPFMGNFCRNDGAGFQVFATDSGDMRKVTLNVVETSLACTDG